MQQPESIASSRFVSVNREPVRSALERSAQERSAPERFASRRVSAVKPGAISAKCTLHEFQASTPWARISRCDSSAKWWNFPSVPPICLKCTSNLRMELLRGKERRSNPSPLAVGNVCLHGVLVCMLRILEEQTPSGVVLKENKDTPAAAEAEVREKKGERESYSSAVL